MDDQGQEEDKYYSLDKIVSISATASALSPFFLGFAVLPIIPLVYTIATSDRLVAGSLLSIFFAGLSQVALSLVFVFLFVILKAIPEVMYLLVEIEEGINLRTSES